MKNPNAESIPRRPEQKLDIKQLLKSLGATAALLVGAAYASHTDAEATQTNQAYLSEHFTPDELAGVALAPASIQSNASNESPAKTFSKKSKELSIGDPLTVVQRENGDVITVHPATQDRVPSPNKLGEKTTEN